MKRRKKAGLQAASNTEDASDRYIDALLKQIREEDGVQEEIDERVRRHKKNRRIRTAATMILLLLILVAAFLFIHLQTYTSVRTVTTYESENAGNASYEAFAGGVLRYSKDGIALVSRKGVEMWNQPCQIRNPVVSTCGNKSAVLADQGGNTVIVLDRHGLKGEIQTTLPVEKVAVSGQGIVCVVVRTESSPKILCYDAGGNILAEITTSLSGTGYPLDVSISEDGTLLLVSFLCVQDGQILTKIRYYNFSGEQVSSQDYEVTADEYADMVAASVFFLNGETSVVAGEDRLLFYSGGARPQLAETVVLDKKIMSVFHSQRYVGLVLKNEGGAGYELCLYRASGKKVLSREIDEDYANVKLCGNQVILYDGRKCSVYYITGVCAFKGAMDYNILEIFPALGVNKYVVMNTNGMEIVRFVK